MVMQQSVKNIFFLHGLDSSGNGTKGRFFAKHFPEIHRPDFTGNLEKRLAQLDALCKAKNQLILTGSSFGGLMACRYALTHGPQVARLILLAPALNFEGYRPPEHPLSIPTLLVIGTKDTVTPIDPVVALAEATFSESIVWTVDDDHLLHNTFERLDWQGLFDTDTDLATIRPPDGTRREISSRSQ